MPRCAPEDGDIATPSCVWREDPLMMQKTADHAWHTLNAPHDSRQKDSDAGLAWLSERHIMTPAIPDGPAHILQAGCRKGPALAGWNRPASSCRRMPADHNAERMYGVADARRRVSVPGCFDGGKR